MAGLAQLPKDSEPFFDPSTKRVARPWRRYFIETRLQIIGVDSTTAGQSVNLAQLDGGVLVIKDEGGMAATNPITITGTVEGVANPTISTNYGSVQIYAHNGLWFYFG